MSDTQPYAYRTHAQELRRQALQLNAEADADEALANNLESEQSAVPTDAETNLPQGGEVYEPEEDTNTEEDKPSRIPFKK